MASSEIYVETYASQALQGNALGDPTERRVFVYLPPDYAGRTDRYPVVFLLAGFASTGVSFLKYEAWEEDLRQRMDRLVASRRVRPMILVLPDAMTRYGGSQYINSSATGRYQDYLLELLDWADHSFRTHPRRESRAVAGKSSGGFGAVTMAMDHPEAFGLVGDHSGDKYFEFCFLSNFPRAHRALASQKDLAGLLRDPRSARPHDQAFRDVMELAAMSSCFSPNAESPYGFDFPVDVRTGALRPDVWERWREHDPIVRLGRATEALRSLRLLYLDCGDRDEYFLNVGARLFHEALRTAEVPHVYEEFEGGHFHLNERLDSSLEAISRAAD